MLWGRCTKRGNSQQWLEVLRKPFWLEAPVRVETPQERTHDSKSSLYGPGQAASTSSSVRRGQTYQFACSATSVIHSVNVTG